MRKVLLARPAGLGGGQDTIHVKLVNMIRDWLVPETLFDYSFRDLLIRHAILCSLSLYTLMAGHEACPE